VVVVVVVVLDFNETGLFVSLRMPVKLFDMKFIFVERRCPGNVVGCQPDDAGFAIPEG
jgi:hypothetical protein